MIYKCNWQKCRQKNSHLACLLPPWAVSPDKAGQIQVFRWRHCLPAVLASCPQKLSDVAAHRKTAIGDRRQEQIETPQIHAVTNQKRIFITLFERSLLPKRDRAVRTAKNSLLLNLAIREEGILTAFRSSAYSVSSSEVSSSLALRLMASFCALVCLL